MEKEFILCAAIDYDGVIISGMRHSHCYSILNLLLTPHVPNINLPDREHQGFLTSKNRFVNRREAWIIAKENNQIKYGPIDDDEDAILISENLY